MKKILILANHRKDRSPGQRFRFEQYIDFLNRNGFQCELSSLLSEKDDKVFYSKGNWISKFLIFIKCYRKRLKDVKRANQFDIIFIFREAFFTGTTYFEKKLKQLPVKIIFDFDDSIWIPNVSDANKNWNWLKNPNKTKEIIAVADLVFAGNNYLANYANTVNTNVVVIPTTIDTDEYKKSKKTANKKIIIGWSGSITTIQHFEYAIPFLNEIKHKYGDKIEIKIIGDENYINKNLGIKGIAWNKENEIKELSTFDIGIMPLPNDEWSKGKCGLKGLQYMALEIPTIMSPVGVNTKIIKDSENGFLANTVEEWVLKISQLIESETLREKIGKNGRITVVENYSVKAIKHSYLNEFNKLIN